MNSAMGLLLLPSWLRLNVPSLFNFLHSAKDTGSVQQLLLKTMFPVGSLQQSSVRCELPAQRCKEEGTHMTAGIEGKTRHASSSSLLGPTVATICEALRTCLKQQHVFIRWR